jgi:orotate phosphoribosyltransferase
VLEILEETGAYLKGHFLLTSGLHSGEFFQCAQLMQYPERTALLCGKLAEYWDADKVDVVVGPATGGILLAYELARFLKARALYAEPTESKEMQLKRGFKIRPGERAVVVDDVITTGGSVKKVIDIVRQRGAEVLGVAALVDRSGGASFGVRLTALVSVELPNFPAEECPLCKKGLPLEDPDERLASAT